MDQSYKWLKLAESYLGEEAKRCHFVHSKLEDYDPSGSEPFDVIWIRWTLQYLIDEDVVHLLTRLRASLLPQGVLVLKENRPMHGSSDCFQMDTPNKEGRFDITRPERHLALLVELSGLSVLYSETLAAKEL